MNINESRLEEIIEEEINFFDSSSALCDLIEQEYEKKSPEKS